MSHIQTLASQSTDRNVSTQACKADLRSALKSALRQAAEASLISESQVIAQRVLDSPFFAAGHRVGLYVHCTKLREVDTTLVLQTALREGKRCYVPVVEDKSSNMRLLHIEDTTCLVAVPPFNIMEPPPSYLDGAPREEGVHLDLLLMPGLGFDTTGRRLGRGGGYYDKMLARLQALALEQGRRPPLTVALAYSCQVVEEVTVDAHDAPVDVVVTASQLHACTERGRQSLADGAAV